MKKVFLFVALLGFITMLISCAVVNEQTLKESGAKLLSQQDLIEFFKVERVGTHQIRSFSVTAHYYPNGTADTIVSVEGFSDEGEYRIENGIFCIKWRKIREGKEGCRRLYYTGENKYEWVNPDDGSHILSMTFK